MIYIIRVTLNNWKIIIMTQVSRKIINKGVEGRILEVFSKVISTLREPLEINDFLDDFLSPPEKIMLAKRLSIALMLAKGYSYDIICEILKVTPSTIASVNINLKYKGRGYKKIVGKILKEEQGNKFWENLEDTIKETLPPRYGSNWTEERRKHYEEKRQRQKPF